MIASTSFIAYYSPIARRPLEPIKVGRHQSEARISVFEARQLISQLKKAIVLAELDGMCTSIRQHVSRET